MESTLLEFVQMYTKAAKHYFIITSYTNFKQPRIFLGTRILAVKDRVKMPWGEITFSEI